MALIIILGLADVFYPYNRGFLMNALVLIYAFTSGVTGYTSISFYCQLEGTNWVKNLLMTGCLFCGPLFLTFCFLNSVAISYRVTAALPFGTLVVIFLIWTFWQYQCFWWVELLEKTATLSSKPLVLPLGVRERFHHNAGTRVFFLKWHGGILPFSALYVSVTMFSPAYGVTGSTPYIASSLLSASFF